MSSDVIDPHGSGCAIDSALDDDRKIRVDIACRVCRYNLRGLVIDQACPECGRAAATSFQGDELLFTDPHWLRRIAGGASLFFRMVIIGLVINLTSQVVEVYVLSTAQFDQLIVQIPIVVLHMLVSALMLWAIVMMTAPQPKALRTQPTSTTRRSARVLLSTGILLATSSHVTLQFLGGSHPLDIGPIFSAIVYWIPSLVAAMLLLLGTAAIFHSGESLAARLPEDRLVCDTRIVRWGLLAALTLGLLREFFMAVVFTLELYDWRQQYPPLSIFQSIAGSVYAVTVVVFGIGMLVLLLRFRKRLLKVASLTSQLTKPT